MPLVLLNLHEIFASRAIRMKPLGVSTRQRSALLPQVPTLAESGAPGYDMNTWWGVLGPAGMSPAIVSRLNSDVAAILGQPESSKRLEAEGAVPSPLPSVEFTRMLMSREMIASLLVGHYCGCDDGTSPPGAGQHAFHGAFLLRVHLATQRCRGRVLCPDRTPSVDTQDYCQACSEHPPKTSLQHDSARIETGWVLPPRRSHRHKLDHAQVLTHLTIVGIRFVHWHPARRARFAAGR